MPPPRSEVFRATVSSREDGEEPRRLGAAEDGGLTVATTLSFSPGYLIHLYLCFFFCQPPCTIAFPPPALPD